MYLTCAEALTDCTGELQVAFDRWGPNLALLYIDDTTGYVGVDLGVFADATYSDAEVNEGALSACAAIAAASDRDEAEGQWFHGKVEQYPTIRGGDAHALFDAAMSLVCPDLGYERAYNWSGIDIDTPTASVDIPGAAPGEPSWQFISCDAALDGFCEESGLAPAFERWGIRLGFMYDDPSSGYEGPVFPTLSDETVPFAVYNAAILSACQHIATPKDAVGGEIDWFQEHLAALAPADRTDVELLFDLTMQLVCPDLGYQRTYSWTS